MKLKGYAAHFGVANKNKEIVIKSSFDASLRDFKNGERTIPINVDHDNNRIVGKVVEMKVDNVGLYIECELIDGVREVNEKIKPLIEGEVFKYFSTEGYVPMNQIEQKDDGTYVAKVFDIRAIAIVTAPADAGATFTHNSQNSLSIHNAFEDVATPEQRMSIYRLI